MQGKDGRRRIWLVLVVAAVVLAAVSGSAVGLGAPAWLAGAVAAVSALAAGAVVNHVDTDRGQRAAAEEHRRQVLDALHDTVSVDRTDMLGLLRADRCPMPFRGRTRELRQLADWL